MKLSVMACAAVAGAYLAAAPGGGQDPQKEQLKIALKDTDLGSGWIYDDLGAGTAAAKKANKPMMVVFR